MFDKYDQFAGEMDAMKLYMHADNSPICQIKMLAKQLFHYAIVVMHFTAAWSFFAVEMGLWTLPGDSFYIDNRGIWRDC